MSGKPTIVLVHGSWADGSCWTGAIERLHPQEVTGLIEKVAEAVESATHA